MGNRPLYIAFLWHMHQPVYSPPDSGTAILPWARLHATKDYADMPILCERLNFPATFNLVPCLLEQIEGYSNGNLTDIYLEITRKPVESLSHDERLFVIEKFFSANEKNIIGRYPRYFELFKKKRSILSQNAGIVHEFSNDDILDLVALFTIAWFGEELLLDPEIALLATRGRNFTEGEKNLLIEKSMEWMRGIVPLYRRLWKEGLIDITMSPYYHPILPLLCRTESAIDANPRAVLPRFKMEKPEDVIEQISKGIDLFEKLFGKKPTGMWPSEGSVSENILPSLIKSSIKWFGTDEEILWKSINRGIFGEANPSDRSALYKVYSIDVAGKSIRIVFRDRILSDAIGFDYAKIPAEKAVNDFIGRLREIYEMNSEEDARLISIILDGENAWEFFPNNGRDFLSLLYIKILKQDWLEPTTFSAFFEKYPETKPLKNLSAGSWIRGDFSTWIGSHEKNKAWDELIKASDAIEEVSRTTDRDKLKRAHEHLLVAEGSDWFWWFGEDNHNPDIGKFDLLFRKRLQSVYSCLGISSPESLNEPIQSETITKKLSRKPIGFLRPKLDGRSTDFFEWWTAGLYENSGFFGAMHGCARTIERVFFGFDLENFFIRIDMNRPAEELIDENRFFIIGFFTEQNKRVIIGKRAGEIEVRTQILDSGKNEWKETEIDIKFGISKVLEVAIPLEFMDVSPGVQIKFFTLIEERNVTIERFPGEGYFVADVPAEDIDKDYWEV